MHRFLRYRLKKTDTGKQTDPTCATAVGVGNMCRGPTLPRCDGTRRLRACMCTRAKHWLLAERAGKGRDEEEMLPLLQHGRRGGKDERKKKEGEGKW